jgi:hypothetical protein
MFYHCLEVKTKDTKVEACGKLLNCTEALIQLYDCLPVINAIQDYGCGYNHGLGHDHEFPHAHAAGTDNNHYDTGIVDR